MSRKLDDDTMSVLAGMTKQWNLDWPSIAHNSAYFGDLASNEPMGTAINDAARDAKTFMWNDMVRRLEKHRDRDVPEEANMLVLLGAIAVLMREASTLYTSAARLHFMRHKESFGQLTEENVIGCLFLMSLSLQLDETDYNGNNEGEE